MSEAAKAMAPGNAEKKAVKQTSGQKLKNAKPTTSHNVAKAELMPPSGKSWFHVIPLALTVSLVPLIVKLKIVPVHSSIIDFWNLGSSDGDFFSYYKSIAVIVLSLFALLLLATGLVQRRIRTKHPLIYLPLAGFALLTILSSGLSEYKAVAMFGFPGRYEGLLTGLAYLTLFLAAVCLLDEKKRIRILLACLTAASVIICIIGIFQFFDLDFFKTSFGQRVIMSSSKEYALYGIKPANNADELYKNAIYSTLFNSNTFGMYISMLFPFSFMLAMTVKNKLHIVLSIIYSCLMFACLLGSYSRGAYAGAAAGILACIIFLICKKCIRGKRIIVIMVLFTAVFAIMVYQSGGVLSQRFSSILHTKNEEPAHHELDKIRDISIGDGELTLFSEFTELKVKLQDNAFNFYDSGNQILDLQASADKMYMFIDEKYDGYRIQAAGNILNIIRDDSFLLFGIVGNQFVPLDRQGRAIDLRPAASFGFKGVERFASARGYIWSRTIPLLRQTIWIGHGPDTFAMYFPQNDFMGKLNFMYDANILIDKPHNIYLQIAVNTGVISLFFFLCLLVYYFISYIRSYKKSDSDNDFDRYGMLIHAAIPGYLVAGLFTDSTVSTSPVFWVLLGAGLCIARLSEKKS